jgi:gamma-glutamyltranspeptidase / glutathione hydrolase
MKYLIGLVFSLSVISAIAAQSPSVAVEAKNGMVVCVSPAAADVGVAILKKGGNAIDAAVAVAFALAVTWPEAGNIGGGGFMHIWPGTGKQPTVIDYREMAPAKSTATMFIDAKADAFSHLSAGVPGTVRGLEMAHKKYGRLSWKDCVEPATQLAINGVSINAALAKRINDVMADSKTTNAEFIRVYGKNGSKTDRWADGDLLKLPDLGKTLGRIRDLGAIGFYESTIAKLIADEMKTGNGIMTVADLANYVAIERPSIATSYRGYTVYTPPLPSGGGVIVAESLNILQQFDVKKHPRESAETIHLMSEAMRRAFADRAKFMGDPKFNEDAGFLTTVEHAKKRAATIDLNKRTPSDQLEDAVPLSAMTANSEGSSTTHFSIVDQNGMGVSNTYTLENSFGSRIVVRGAGFILNNEMTDFNIRPGVTTKSGGVGTKPNRIAPGKRMLSSQCPTIVTKEGKLFLLTGSPGGRTIPNTVLSILVNVLDYDMEIQAAVDSPRHHHQWFPDRIMMERIKDRANIAGTLKSMGHDVVNNRQGDGHTIQIDPKSGMFRGAADHRIDGQAAGY